MRIISQDGCYDMPYEQTMLTNIGTKIYADNLAVKELCVAEYSTGEKAIKAMEMCRKKYADCNFSKELIPTLATLGSDVGINTEDALNILGKTFAFQFPADEEVGV